MKLLVLHGSSANLGDTAMLEGVVLNLLRNVPAAELFVADRPGLRTGIWDLARVHRQRTAPLLFRCEQVIKQLPYVWRYEQGWREAVRCWSTLGLGRLLSKTVTILPGSAGVNGRQTLDKFCAGFDGLHMVGGGYLTDTFPDVLVHASCFGQAFVQQGKPVVLTGQQVGPFQSRALEMLARRLLRSARFVGLREPRRSKELCRKFGLEPNRFQVTGDDSFGLPSAGEAEISACLAAHGLHPGGFLAFNVRVAPYAAGHQEYLHFIARVAEELAVKLGLRILMVPIAFNDCDSDDRNGQALSHLMSRIEPARIDSSQLTPSLARGVLGKAFGAIGVSYHFCTFALSNGVPAICLYEGDYYSQKADGICQFWEDDRLALSLRKAEVPSAVAQILSVLQDSGFRARLAGRARLAVESWHQVFDAQIQKNFKSPVSPAAPTRQEGAHLAAEVTDSGV